MREEPISRRSLLLGHPTRPASGIARPDIATVTDACLAKQDVACQSCGESCPENAIRFRPRLGGPFLPDLDEQLCTGCGACLEVCPAGAIATKPRKLELSDV
ncbi:4Fe-4S dicluster domain-containing protein [Rhizobium sp. YR295]|jgi:ferredoxin-type protein NapF